MLLGNLTPEVLLSFDGVTDHVRALIPYTERHLQRLDRLEEVRSKFTLQWLAVSLQRLSTVCVCAQLSMFVEYSCQKMSLSLTEEDLCVDVEEGGVGRGVESRGVEHTLAAADTTTPHGEPCTVSVCVCVCVCVCVTIVVIINCLHLAVAECAQCVPTPTMCEGVDPVPTPTMYEGVEELVSTTTSKLTKVYIVCLK